MGRPLHWPTLVASWAQTRAHEHRRHAKTVRESYSMPRIRRLMERYAKALEDAAGILEAASLELAEDNTDG